MRVAVIGVGSIGKHHARVYSELEGVQLVAVADLSDARRADAARRYKVATYSEAVELFAREQVDAVSIAVPTALHYQVALAAIERGIHVLVEKPIAATEEEAQEMIALAAQKDVTLTVGHVERFNPAVVELKRRLQDGDLGHIFQVHASRISPFPSYVEDVGVVMDLATHELDIMRYIVTSDVVRVFAETDRKIHKTHEDMLSGTVKFANGVLGVLDINWLTPTKVRELRVSGERGMFVVDYIRQDLTFYENSNAPAKWDAMALFRGIGEGNVIKLRLNKVEPLAAELRSFVDAVSANKPPLVSGLDGLWALKTAHLLLKSAKEAKAITLEIGH